MSITQLADGGAVTAPNGPLKIRLDSGAGVELVLADDAGREIAAHGRLSGRELIIAPQGDDILVVARIPGGGSFPPGSMVGVTVSSPSPLSPESIVRVPVDAGGRTSMTLIRISASHSMVQIIDVASSRNIGAHGTAAAVSPLPLTPRPWQRPGMYGYHAHHAGAQPAAGPWALVVDGSASMLAPQRRAGIGVLLETLFGITAAARGGAPHGLLLCRSGAPRDFGPSLEADRVEWPTALGDLPSPSSRVTPGVTRAAELVGREGLVVLVTDGAPVDATELVDWSRGASAPQLQMVVLGRSHREYLPESRPGSWWDEELAILDPLGDGTRHALVAVQNPAGVRDAAAQLADALHPTVAVR